MPDFVAVFCIFKKHMQPKLLLAFWNLAGIIHVRTSSLYLWWSVSWRCTDADVWRNGKREGEREKGESQRKEEMCIVEDKISQTPYTHASAHNSI